MMAHNADHEVEHGRGRRRAAGDHRMRRRRIGRPDGTVSGRTACNSFDARYEADGPKLSTSRLVATDVACEGYAAELEAALLDVLHGDSIDIETNTR